MRVTTSPLPILGSTPLEQPAVISWWLKKQVCCFYNFLRLQTRCKITVSWHRTITLSHLLLSTNTVYICLLFTITTQQSASIKILFILDVSVVSHILYHDWTCVSGGVILMVEHCFSVTATWVWSFQIYGQFCTSICLYFLNLKQCLPEFTQHTSVLTLSLLPKRECFKKCTNWVTT